MTRIRRVRVSGVIAFMFILAAVGPAFAQTEIGRVSVGSNPHFVAVNPNTNRVYVTNDLGSSVSVIDPRNNNSTRTLAVGERPRGVAVSKETNRVYVANYWNGTLSVFDGTNDAYIGSFYTAGFPSYVTVANGLIFLGHQTSGPNLSIWRESDWQWVRSIAVSPGPMGLAVDSRRNILYAQTIYGLDAVELGNNDRIVSIPAGRTFLDIDEEADRIYVVHDNANTLTTVQGHTDADGTRSYSIEASILLPAGPGGIGFDSVKKQIYVASYWNPGYVSVIDANTNRVTNTVQVCCGQTGLAVDEELNRIYVTNVGESTVTIFEGPPPPTPPTVQDMQVGTTAGMPVNITLAATSANGGTLTYVIDNPHNGTLSGTGPGVTYTPSPGFTGIDSFTYKVIEAGISSNIGNVTINVTPPANTAPQITLVSTTPAVKGISFEVSGSFTDPEFDTWTATVDYADGAGPQPLTLNANKTFRLTHTYASTGDRTVTVTVSDARASTRALLTVDVCCSSTTFTEIFTYPELPDPTGPIPPGSLFLPPRKPADMMRWDPERAKFVIDYGSGNGTPGQLLSTNMAGFCSVTRGLFGNRVVGVTASLIPTGIPGISYYVYTANNDDLQNLQAALPSDYKWVGMAYTSQCMNLSGSNVPHDSANPFPKVRIDPPSVDCLTLREYFIKLMGESPEEMFINLLPLPPGSDVREFLLERLNFCTGLNLSGIPCEQAIDLVGELSALALPGLGAILDSPVMKFIAKSILCGFDLEVPDVHIKLPPIDFGFGAKCWFGCSGSGSGGDDGGSPGGSGGGSGGSGNGGTVTDAFGGPLWFPMAPGTFPYDCGIVPADWATTPWSALVSRATAQGIDARLLLNSIIACKWPYPVPGFPYPPATMVLGWTTPAAASYGTPLSAIQLNATANIPGTFVYSPAQGAILDAGPQSLTATFNPSDAARFQPQTITTLFQVTKTTPAISIAGASLIYNGSAQSATVRTTGALGESLMGTTVSYNGGSSAPVDAGTYTVTAAFGGDSNYNPATATATLVLEKAPLVVTADDKSRPYGAQNPLLTGIVSGVKASDAITATFTTSASNTSPVGTYDIVPTLTDPANRLRNYTSTIVNGKLTIHDGTPPLLSNLLSPISNAAGWNNTDVNVQWTVSDPESGIASRTGCESMTLTAETAGLQLTCSASNGAGLSFTRSTIVKIDKTAPSTANLAFSKTPLAINSSVTLTASVTDPLSGVISAEYTLDGGQNWVSIAQTPAAQVSVSVATPVFIAAGVYNVCVRGKDAAGNAGTPDCGLLPVYDPVGGFVTGGGWINSPAGAFLEDASLSGKANFAFVSKYLKGAAVPSGQTQFQFKLAGLNFNSSVYDWLVVAGSKAQYQGSGTINGTGDYAFLLTATDGEGSGGGGVDKFRIKIWHKGTGGVVYDNLRGTSDDPADANVQAISGGNILIHAN